MIFVIRVTKHFIDLVSAARGEERERELFVIVDKSVIFFTHSDHTG